jgi:hypothetical protein
MNHFVQATEYDMSMHAKIQYLNLYEVLSLNNSCFDFLDFSMRP